MPHRRRAAMTEGAFHVIMSDAKSLRVADAASASALRRGRPSSAKHKKGIHSASSMSDIILWNKPTLNQGIKAFERKYKVKIVFSNKVYNDKL